MTANTWYCIAKTSTFDTGCSINVAFDGYDIQFSVSVKLGISAINITRCTIPDGIVFSIRLREGGSEWFVDLNSNTNISPIVTIADTEYWSNVNKPAREGNIILQLYDITSKCNTSTGGDSLFEIVNVGSVDTPRYAVVPKLYEGQNPGVISRTFMSFGGLGADTGDEGDGVAYLRNLLDVELANILEDEDVLTYDKHLDLWVNKRGGLNEEKLKEFLDKHKYITEDYVKDLMKLLGWFEFDKPNHAVRVKNGYNFIVDGALSFGGIGQNEGPTPGGLSQVTIQLGENPKDSYVSENGIVILPAYPVVPTKVSAFENDEGYVVSSALDEYAKLTDIPVMEDFALAEDLNKLSKQVQGYENKFTEIGGSITDLETDISKLASIEDLEKLEEAVNPLFGYFDANGNANNALKLGGHSAEYFATADALNTHITAFNNYKTTTDNRLNKLEDLWYMDDDGNVHTTHNIIVEGGGAFGKGAESGGDVGGLGKVTIYLEGSNIPYESDASGKIVLPAYPSLSGYATENWVSNNYQPKGNYLTSVAWGDVSGKPSFATVATSGKYSDLSGTPSSLPASDVYAWAKKSSLAASDVPSLDWSKITSGKPTTLGGYGITDALSTSGGTITGGFVPLHLKSNASAISMRFGVGDTTKAELTWDNTEGVYIYNYPSGCFIGVKNDGTPNYNGKTLIHSGNYSSYALPLSGGVMTGDISYETDSHGVYFFQGCGIEKWSGYGPSLVAEGDNTDFWIRNGVNRATSYKILHSGNYSSYALPISGGTIEGGSGALQIKSGADAKISLNNTDSDNKFQYIAFLQNDVRYGYLGTLGNDDLLWSGNIIIHSGNINSYNAGSATKLQDNTAFTAWGQTFFQNGVPKNVTGPAIMQYLLFPDSDGGESGYIGRGGDDDTLYFRSYKNAPIHIGRNNYNDIIIKDGNLLIGTPNANGAKLQVNGGVTTYGNINMQSVGEIQNALAISRYDNGTGYYVGSRNAGLGVTDGGCLIYTYGSTPISFYTYGSERMKINGSGGNVSIYGNLTVTGGGAFGSDIRYKDITSYRQIDLATIADAPLFTFKWTDREDKVEHLGTSAQYWLDTQFKDAVNTANKDFYHLDYGALAVGIGISVAREVKGVKTEVQLLREKVNQLEQELAQYRRV